MLSKEDLANLENAADLLEEKGHIGAKILRELIRVRLPQHVATNEACKTIVRFLRDDHGTIHVRYVDREYRNGDAKDVQVEVSARGQGFSGGYEPLDSQNIFAAIARHIENARQITIRAGGS